MAEEAALSDLLSQVIDHRGKTPKKLGGDFAEDGVEVVSAIHIKSGRIDWSQRRRFVSREMFERWMPVRLMKDDLLLTSEAPLGEVALVPDGRDLVLSQRLFALRGDATKLHTPFLYYYFQTAGGQSALSGRSSGTTVVGIRQSELLRIRVPYPPLDEQRRIAEVLGALDDLIDTNERLANKLWTAAELSFARCQSERGTRVPLGSLIELKYGKALPADVRRPGHVPVVSSAGISGSHDIALVEGPGVVVGRKGSVGSVTWVGSDFFPIDTAFYVKTLEIPLIWAYFVLKSLPLESMNTDSAVPGLNRSNALALEVARPAESILSEFNRQALALIESAGRLHEEIDQLRHTRDELLPLLMLGKVRVRPEGENA